MKKRQLVSVFGALVLGAFVGSVYSADEHPAMGSPADGNTAGTVSKPAKSVKKKKSVRSHDPQAGEVQGRKPHRATPHSDATVKSHDPAASEVTGRATHPDASEGSDVKSPPAGQQQKDRGN